MTELSEHFDSGFDRALEIRVDPGVIAARETAAKRDKRSPLLDEIIDTRVDGLGVGDNQAIDKPTRSVSFRKEPNNNGSLTAVQKDGQIEALLQQAPAQSVEDGKEHRIDQVGIAPRRNDHTDEFRPPATQAAAGLIGRIAEPRRGFANAIAGLGINVRPVVQRSRDGPDRYVEMTREVADSCQVRFSFRRPAAGSIP